MNYEIIVIILEAIIGLIVAFITVYLEYRKDKKEKLQDRKDMWLDAHYKELYNDLANLYNFNERIYKENEPQTLQGYDKLLETEIVKYKYNSELIGNEAYLKINLDNVKKHTNILWTILDVVT